MNLIGRTIVCFALIMASLVPAIGQQSAARINGVRGAVEIVDRSGAAVGPTVRPLLEQDTIRTGADSAITLMIGKDVSISLGERTEVEIRKLGISPVLWFEHGNIQVNSAGAAVQIQARSGWFSASEWPFGMEIGDDKGATSIIVTAGAVKTQDLDTSSVTFRAAGNNAYRTYSAGGNRQHDTPVPDSPPLFIQPVIRLGGQADSKTPAPNAPSSKPPIPNN